MGIIHGYTENELSQEVEIAIKKDSAREARRNELMGRLGNWLGAFKNHHYSDNFRSAQEQTTDLTLSPQDIGDVIASLHTVHDDENYGNTGLFISALMQNAYENRHNDFMIASEMLPAPINCVGDFVEGSRDTLLQCTITGNNVYSAGNHAHYLHLTTKGHVGNPDEDFIAVGEGTIGEYAEHCHFVMHGYVSEIGMGSENCKYYSPFDELLEAIQEQLIEMENIDDAELYKIQPNGLFTRVFTQ